MPYADRDRYLEYHREYYRKNRERMRAAGREYAINNSAEATARAAKWAAENPEKMREHRRQWKKNNPEKVRAANAMRTPEARRAHADREALRRAAKRVATAEDIDRFRVWFLGAGRCGICDGHVDVDEMHVDHIHPLARGGSHTYGNVQPAHARCNLRKGAIV